MSFLWRVNQNGYCWSPGPDDQVLSTLTGSGGWKEYAPLERYTGLFLNFANTEPTEEGTLAFVNRFGTLGVGLLLEWVIRSDDFFSYYEEQICIMRGVVDRW